MHASARKRAVGAAVFAVAFGLTGAPVAAQTAPSTTQTTELDVGGGGTTTSTTEVGTDAGSTETTTLDADGDAAAPNRVDAGGGGTASDSVPYTATAFAVAGIAAVGASAFRARRWSSRH